MGAGRKRSIPWRHTEAELLESYRRCPDKQGATRAMALLLVRQGRTNRQAAAQLGVSANAVVDWLRRYRRDGLEAVLALRRGARGGPQPRLSAQARAEIRRLALAGEIRTARDAVDAAVRVDGYRYSEGGMRRLMRRMRLRKNVPRPANPKADRAAQQAWKKGG